MPSPEMLSAIANIVMAMMNITLFGIGAIALRNDRRRLSAVEESERRRFADEVFAWIEEAGSGSALVQCRNGANSVIYDVRVALSGPDQGRVGKVYEIDLMKPLEERSLKVEGAGVESAVAVAVYFRDPAGHEWMRAPDGRIFDAGAATALPPGAPLRALERG